MLKDKRMMGQLSHREFCDSHSTASTELVEETLYAITRYGQSTRNYWIQHDDTSWTNYDCRTLD